MSKYKKQQNLQEVATVLGSGAVYLAKLVAGDLIYDTAMEAFVGDAFAATADGTTTGRFKQEMINAYQQVADWYNTNVPKGPYQAKKEKITIIPGIEWVRTKDPITKFIYGDGPDELDEQTDVMTTGDSGGGGTMGNPMFPSPGYDIRGRGRGYEPSASVRRKKAEKEKQDRQDRLAAIRKKAGGEWRRKSVNWLFRLDKQGYDENSQMVVTGTAEEPIWVVGDWQRRVYDRDEEPGGNIQLRKYNQIRRKLKKTSAKAKAQLQKLQQENPEMYQSFLQQLKKEQASMKNLEIQDLVKQIEQENLLDENEMIESFKNFSFKKEEPVQQAPPQKKPQKTSTTKIRKTPASGQQIRTAQSGEEVAIAAGGLFEFREPEKIEEIAPVAIGIGGAIAYLASCIAWEAIDPAVVADATMDGSWARTILRGYDNMEAWYNENVPYGPTQAKRDGIYIMPGIEWIPEEKVKDFLDRRDDVDEQEEVNSMKGGPIHRKLKKPKRKVQEQEFTPNSSAITTYRTAKRIKPSPKTQWAEFGGRWVRAEGYLLKSIDRQQYDKNSQVVLSWRPDKPDEAEWVLGDMHRKLIDGDMTPGGDPKLVAARKKAQEKAKLARAEVQRIKKENPEKYTEIVGAVNQKREEFKSKNLNAKQAIQVAQKSGLLGSNQKVSAAADKIRKEKTSNKAASQATADSIRSSTTNADTSTAASSLFEEYFSKNKKILRKIENNNLIKIIREELDDFLLS